MKYCPTPYSRRSKTFELYHFQSLREQSSSTAPSAKEKSHSLEFLSKEYDDFLLFKTTANKELQRLSSQLSQVKARVDAIANAIDEFQEYSFQYNVKIVGVPEVCSDEAASTTSKLCVKLFKEIGQCKTQTADCRPGLKCRLCVKCRLQTESKTQAGVKCRPSINRSRGLVERFNKGKKNSPPPPKKKNTCNRTLLAYLTTSPSQIYSFLLWDVVDDPKT